MAERKSAKQLQIDEVEQNGKKDEREKALAETFKSIEKTYGKGSVMRLGDVVNENYYKVKSGDTLWSIAKDYYDETDVNLQVNGTLAISISDDEGNYD